MTRHDPFGLHPTPSSLEEIERFLDRPPPDYTVITPAQRRRDRAAGNLALVLAELLDDGTGRIHPELEDFWAMVSTMPEPARGLVWLHNNPHVVAHLHGLARGDIPLTHDALHALPSPRTTAHLRDLLMESGALPRADRQLLLFEQWSQHQLAAITDAPTEQLLRQFLAWQQLPALRAAARRGPLSTGTRNGAAAAFTHGHRFLRWIAHRHHDLATLDQATLDLFHTTAPTAAARPGLHRFLRWATHARHMPRLQLPRSARTTRPAITQKRRLELIHRMLTDTALTTSTRVAALLLLLFAQPITTLLQLTIHDVDDRPDGPMMLRLGTPSCPVPEPFAPLLRQHIATRTNRNTATNPDSSWLFPGARAAQPLHPSTIRHRFQALGIPTTQARTSALRQLVLQAPAPVIATALGYHHGTAHQHHVDAGGTWNRYPATRP